MAKVPRIKFELRDPGENKTTSIRLKIHSSGQRFVLGIGKSIHPELWNSKLNRAIVGKSDDPNEEDRQKKLIRKWKRKEINILIRLKNINILLDGIEKQSINFFVETKRLDQNSWKEDFKNYILDNTSRSIKLLKSNVDTNPKIIEIIREFIQAIKAENKKELSDNFYFKRKILHQGNPYSEGTIQKYETFFRLWTDFVSTGSYKFDQINESLYLDLKEYFLNPRPKSGFRISAYNENTSAKHLTCFKSVIRAFIKNAKLYNRTNQNKKVKLYDTLTIQNVESSLDDDFKAKQYRANDRGLTEKEISLFESADLSTLSKGYEIAQDLFILGCYTTQRYSDIIRLTDHIVYENMNGQKTEFFKFTQKKTRNEVRIPVFPQVRKILNKWDNKIPLLSNGKMNKYIKEIGRIAGIENYHEIKTKTARYTGSTLFKSLGIPTIHLTALTGHKSTRVLEGYLKSSQEESLSLIQKAAKDLEKKSLSVEFKKAN